MNKIIMFVATAFVFLTLAAVCHAGQTVVVKKVTIPPVIDGNGSDEAWAQASECVTYDGIAKINISLKAVYTDARIFFLVSYPDADRSVTHKTWEWNKATQMYKTGGDREDAFVFKWNMETHPVDLSLRSEDDYAADIWFWKACRTDPMGYADDKIDRVRSTAVPKSAQLTGKNGKTMYMLRNADSGKPPYRDTLFEEYEGDKMPGLAGVVPEGSCADIKAKGSWADGRWTIEFGRSLDTGHEDDVLFDTSKTYAFGVSRYEIAGRPPDPELSQPLYGCGDISEELKLKFGE
jgi:hypothetical protein